MCIRDRVNVLASAFMAGCSGSAVSDVAGLGKVEIKAMEDAGYDTPFAAAVTAATATIGPIIPPSIPMVMYGSIAGVSVVKLFLGGIGPGVLMIIAMMLIVYVVSKRRCYPREERSTLKQILIFYKKLSCNSNAGYSFDEHSFRYYDPYGRRVFCMFIRGVSWRDCIQNHYNQRFVGNIENLIIFHVYDFNCYWNVRRSWLSAYSTADSSENVRIIFISHQ